MLTRLNCLIEAKDYPQSTFKSKVRKMSLIMRKPAFCICENKDADQLRGNHEGDQRLCFRYTDSTIPLHFKSEISSLLPSSVAARPGLCGTWSETQKDRFSHNEAKIYPYINLNKSGIQCESLLQRQKNVRLKKKRCQGRQRTFTQTELYNHRYLHG